MEDDSLFNRLQKRYGTTTTHSEGLGTKLYDEVNVENESDIDDDITLDECERFIDSRKEKTFTHIKSKSFESAQESNGAVLSHVITDTCVIPDIPRLDEDSDGISSIFSKQPIDSISNDSNDGSVEVDTQPKVKKKRTVLTAEERKSIKEQKEKEKLEKQRKRQEIKIQKELEKERLRAIKNAEAMAARSEKKDECLDRMLAVVDPCLLQETGGGDILKDLQDINVRYELKALPIVCCIGWMRESVEYKVDSNRKVNKSVTYSEEDHIMHKITAYELATRIQAQNTLQECEETFSNLVKTLQSTFTTKKITIVVVGINAYHRLVKTKQNEEFRKKALGDDQPGVKRKKKDQLVPTITKEEIDKHLINIQLTTNISIRFCEDMSDFSKLILSFTKAMAEAPFKKAPVSALQFSTMLPSNKGVFKICEDGHGVSQVWNQQLQQFYGVRNDTSSAITQLYPTPLALLKTYQTLSSETEGVKLLQDIEVRRGVGVLQTKRRVGPELSKKIYKLFSSLDGNDSLGR